MKVDQPIGIQCGSKWIHNILDAKPEEIDVDFIDERKHQIRRFGGDERALTLHQHCRMMELMYHPEFHENALAELPHTNRIILSTLRHHDDHEAIIGDIINPMKRLIGRHSPVVRLAEDSLDRAIFAARGLEMPGEYPMRWCKALDASAQTIEWVFHMGNDPAPWNAPVNPLCWSKAEELLRRTLA